MVVSVEKGLREVFNVVVGSSANMAFQSSSPFTSMDPNVINNVDQTECEVRLFS